MRLLLVALMQAQPQSAQDTAWITKEAVAALYPYRACPSACVGRPIPQGCAQHGRKSWLLRKLRVCPLSSQLRCCHRCNRECQWEWLTAAHCQATRGAWLGVAALWDQARF